ncbi:hypothetical protein GCM10012275_38130 [Longimycelium tulufanense]|uniref:Uncharacterized protein n=1 Tax=Longimycelium tulufanense TaxID=907463 RepID=A0A8J3CGT1_9PSEU|nr:hypothetical protein [Longimycelium tulufanense]GGM63941.1 hypothetical protein GCM10012275_38130 [Longimycelium tulufanense]
MPPSRRREPRTRLAQLVKQRRWSVEEFCARFTEAGRGEGTVSLSRRQATRWLSGDVDEPRPAQQRVLEHLFGEPLEALLGSPVTSADPVAPPPSDEERLMTAARDTTAHVMSTAAALDPIALEQLHAEARRLAHAYFHTAPAALARELLTFRQTVRDQLERTRKPGQQAELYLILGQVSGLLSASAAAVGQFDVAEEYARGAYGYGSLVDSPSLCAWARAWQVASTFWSGRAHLAAELSAAAVRSAPPGTARARLWAVNARALALLGARGEVEQALGRAADELDRAGSDPLLDGVGGELCFGRSRTALCAGTAYVALRDAHRAEEATMLALRLFAERERWRPGELGATVDLAAARTLRGDLAGAEEALAPVFTLELDHRTEALRLRLVHLTRVLGTARYRQSLEARRITEQATEFVRPAGQWLAITG